MRRIRTSSLRLALLYAGLFSASVLILFGVIYWYVIGYAERDESDEIGIEYVAIEDEMRLAGEDRLPEIIGNHIRQRQGERVAYLLEDSQGHKKAGNVEATAFVEGPTTVEAEFDGHRRKLPAIGYRLANGDHLLIGKDLRAVQELRELIARIFTACALLTLGLAAFGGVVISSRALRRVDQISRTTRAIVAGDLSQRIPLRGADDEFDQLSDSVNAMLDRIEDLMRNLRQVSTDIAHDLRTPLSRLRQRLELALNRESSADDLRSVLAETIVQVDSILETFAALLRLAQIESGSLAAPAPIDVSTLLARIADDFAPAAEDRGQSLSAEIAPGLEISGDRQLLSQMIVNLIDNALRHSEAGARIALLASRKEDAVEIAVTDTGPGIPSHERENVFRPFYRLEASRTTEGSGLGLSLVAAIAKRHRARLTLTDNGPGLRVLLAFPAAASSS